MICGGDYHGGNNQNGCGTSFHWSTAAKYVSSIYFFQLDSPYA